MQKKLIALAIAGLATAPAFAQTNVTIYGVADLTQEYVDGKGAATTSVARRCSGSAWTSRAAAV
ncbi:MAG: porin [Comamonadaceae bacterium]|nr:porin [Comamonadaceae bacterium]